MDLLWKILSRRIKGDSSEYKENNLPGQIAYADWALAESLH
jgi:hypothetical protein